MQRTPKPNDVIVAGGRQRSCTACGKLLTERDRLLCQFCRQRAIRLVDEGVQVVCHPGCDESDCCLRCVLRRAA